MDANLIYVKTASGEEAVRQRTRVVQRNTRMVLILVDGTSTVADLCQKTGNVQLVESALQDLERDGLIAPKLEQDSVWEQSRKLAEEIKAAAVTRLAREVPKEAPLVTPQIVSAQGPEPFSIAPVSIAPFSTFGGKMPHSMAPFSTFGDAPPATPSPVTTPVAPPPKATKPGWLAALFARKRKEAADAGIAPIQRGGEKTYISLPLALALGVGGLIALLVLVFLLYPYDGHKPQIEATLSRLAGQPVRVASVQAELMPKPGIVLASVSSGDGGDLRAARVRLIPEIFSLLGARPVFSLVEIEGGRLSAKALAALPKGLAGAVGDDPAVSVKAIRFNELAVDLIGLPVGSLQAEIRPDEKGKLGPLVFHSADRSLKATLQAQAGGFVAEVEALAWQPTAESRFRFDSLQGQITWDGRQMFIRSLDARIFDGAILGTLTLDVQSGQPGIAGSITVKHMSAQRLADGLGYGRQYEGELAGALNFGARSATWAALLPSATGEGSFAMTRGALGGFDLVEAVRRGKTPVRGGTTRYEQLSGNLKITPDTIRFSDINLSSGLLRAGGIIELSRDDRLAGRFDVEMRGTANVVRMPVSVSGGLKDPVLQGGRQ